MLSGIRTSRVSDTDNTYASPSGSTGSGELERHGTTRFATRLPRHRSPVTDGAARLPQGLDAQACRLTAPGTPTLTSLCYLCCRFGNRLGALTKKRHRVVERRWRQSRPVDTAECPDVRGAAPPDGAIRARLLVPPRAPTESCIGLSSRGNQSNIRPGTPGRVAARCDASRRRPSGLLQKTAPHTGGWLHDRVVPLTGADAV